MTKIEHEDLTAFVGILEYEQIERIDALLKKIPETGYVDDDLKRIVLFGDAIRAIKENIEFRKRVDL